MTVPANPSRRSVRAALGLLFAIALAACEGRTQQTGGERERPPPTVRVAEVEMRSVDVREQYAGRARGAREVEVRARVEGTLEQRGYVEGALVT